MQVLLGAAIEEFYRSDECARAATGTMRHRVRALRVLVEVCSRKMPVARLSRAHIDEVLSIARDGCSESSLNMYRSALRVFCKWAVDSDYLKRDVSSHMKFVTGVTEPGKRKPVSADQITQMFKLADERHPRDGISVRVLAFTALRESEVCALRWRDCDFDRRRFSAPRRKVNDRLIVPWDPQLAEAMAEWRAYVLELHGAVQPDWYVLPALKVGGAHKMNREWPMDPTRSVGRLYPIVKRLLRRIGEPDLDGRGVHVLRRSAATMLLAKTGDIRTVQRLLGHSKVTTTEVYLDVDAETARLEAAMSRGLM